MAEGAILLPEQDLGAYRDLPDAPREASPTSTGPDLGEYADLPDVAPPPPAEQPRDVDLGEYADLPDLSPTPATEREVGGVPPDISQPDTSQLGDYADLPDDPNKPVGADTAMALAETPEVPVYNPREEEIRAPELRDQPRLLLSNIEHLTDKLFEVPSPSGARIVSKETMAVPVGIFAGGARTAAKLLSAVTGEEKYKEAEAGVEETLAEAGAAFTDLESIAGLLTFAVPGVAESYAVNVLAKLPDQYGHLKDTIKEHGLISKESAVAATEAGIQDLMGFLAGHGAKLTTLKRPARPGSQTDIMRKQLAGKEPSIAGPALVDDAGKVLAAASVGFSHADLLGKAVGTPIEEAVMAAFLKDENHKFIDAEGNVWNREQAANIAVRAGQVPKETTKLQSQDLIKGGERGATKEIKQPESVQAESKDRTKGGEEKETGPSDRIQRAEEGGKEEVAVYRGEPKGPSPAGSAHGIGTYYGLTPDVAQRFSREGTVQPSKLNLSNPLRIASDAELRAIRESTGVTSDPRMLLNKAEAEKFSRSLQDKGYDSLIIDYPEAPGGKQVVVFEPVSKPSEQLAKETPSEPGIAAPAVEPLDWQPGKREGTYIVSSEFGFSKAEADAQGNVRLRNVQIEPEARGKGHGKAFAEAVVREAGTKFPGAKEVVVWAFPEAEGFWEKSGFTKTGETKEAGDSYVSELRHAIEPDVGGIGKAGAAVEPHAIESGGAMGAAKFGEVERGREPISMANAAVDARREAEGREPIFSEARQADPLLWDQAMARIDRNANAPAMLVDAINAGEVKAASPVEQMMLLHEEIRLQNEKAQESVRARDDTLGEDIQAEHRANYAAAERRLDATERANRAYGTIAGRALRSRRIAAFDDFTLAAMETRARNAKGGPLTEAESLKIEAQSKEIETLKAEIAARPDVDAMAVMRTLMTEQARELRGAAKAGGFVQAMHSARDAAIKRSLERRRQGRLYSGVDPQALLDAVIIGAAHIADGVRDFGAWSKKMLDDLGEGVRDSLDDLFKRSKQYHDANEKAAKPKAPKGAKPKPTAMDRIAKQSQEGKPLGQKAIYDRMREHINEGLVEGMEPNKALDTLIEAVKADLKDIFPDVTKVEIRDAFTEYGKQQIPSKEKDRVQLREYRRLGQLRSSIERVLAGKRPLKTGFLRDKPTQAIREGMKELNDAMREAGFESTGPEQLASRNVARETALRNQIADIEKELATGERRKPAEPVPDTPRVKELRARRDELRKQLEEARKADPGFEAARDKALLQRYKTYLDNKTATLKERIKKGDYAKVEKKAKVLDKEAKQKKFQLSEVQKEFNRGVLELKLKNRTKLEKVWGGVHQGLNLSRNMITTADLSAVLRQGGFIVLGHPVRGAQAMGPMLRAFASEKQRFEIMEGIRHDENFGFAEQAGLFIQDERGIDLLKQEEQFMGRWAQALADLPKKAVVGIPFKLVTASERAYTTFLNKLRMDSFNAMIKTAGRAGHEITLKEAKAIANFINVATGRGNLEGVAKAAANLNGIFFAPRYVASRFQLLLGEPMWGGSALTRRMIGEEYGRALIGIMTVYGLGKLAGGEIETDRRSSDFGKIRFGNTRVDPMFGLSQTAVLINRIKSGESKQLGGKVVPLTGKVPFGGQTLDDVMWRFFRSKLSPAAGSAVNIVRGQDVVGNPVTPMSELFHNITPLAFQDVSKAMQDQGIARGTALGALAIFGMGLQTYTPRNPEKLPAGTTTKSKSKPYVP